MDNRKEEPFVYPTGDKHDFKYLLQTGMREAILLRRESSILAQQSEQSSVSNTPHDSITNNNCPVLNIKTSKVSVLDNSHSDITSSESTK